MSQTFKVELTLSDDGSDTINFLDTYDALDDIWYKFTADDDGGVTLLANCDGFEHLARYFLKLARTHKSNGFHSHHSLEFGAETVGAPELTIGMSQSPD